MTSKLLGLGSLIAATFLFTVAITAETTSSDEPISQAPLSEWKLPEGTEIDPGSFRASADLAHVLFLEPGTDSIEILRRLFPMAYWRLNTKTGELTNVLDNLGIEEGQEKLLVKPCGLSANGKYALVLAARVKRLGVRKQSKEGYSAYLVTLEDGSSQKIGEKIATAAWLGDKIVLSRFEGKSRDRKIAKITLFDPADESASELNISGLIISAHPDGRMLVYGCDPEDPVEPTLTRNLSKAKMVVITTEGEVLRQLGVVPPSGARPDELILSANGKYVAFRQGRIVRKRKPRNVKVRVMTTSGDEEWIINETATPIGMTDDGRVIIVGNVFEDEGAVVEMWDKNFNRRTILANVAAATVVGDRLFYLTTGEQPLIKSIKLDL